MLDDKFDNSEHNDLYEIKEDGGDDEITNATQPTEQEQTAESTPSEPTADSASEQVKNDESSSISSDLIRGHINTIILRALYERDKYGYEIMNDIEEKSHGQYSLKQPTLYSALKRLENQGYIKAYWKTDEVSGGGRRKYFSLTESGKEITEKNLAEWEYSRTIIDSLISDRSFDFSQPAPTPVDFTILRNSVSRVPVIKNGDEKEEKAENSEAVNTEDKTDESKRVSDEYRPAIENTVKTDDKPSEQVTAAQPANVTSEQVVSATPPQPSAAEVAQSESRRIAHENYLRLISAPVREPEPREDIVPNSENVNTDRLMYNNRPETERDYKNLIDGIFARAVANGSEQTYYAQPKPKQSAAEVQRSTRIIERGQADGVTISAANNSDVNATYATKTTYNKGLTLFKCSAIVLAITVIEFIFCFIFLKQLNTTWIYPTVILLLGLAQFGAFGILTLQGFGKNCVRPTSNGYISSCIILTIISILIIASLSFLMNVNPNSVSDIMKMIVIPSITALNITVFAVSFKLFLK